MSALTVTNGAFPSIRAEAKFGSADIRNRSYILNLIYLEDSRDKLSAREVCNHIGRIVIVKLTIKRSYVSLRYTLDLEVEASKLICLLLQICPSDLLPPRVSPEQTNPILPANWQEVTHQI